MLLRKVNASLSLLTVVCVVLTLAIHTTPVLAGSDNVVISEFRTRGPLGGNDEFVELYNLSSSPVNIGGWTIRGSNASGAASVRATIPAGVTLNPGCHYLIANGTASSGYSGSVTPNQTYSTGITDDGGIGLFSGAAGVGFLVDAVGMSSGSVYREGTTLAPLTTNVDRGYERKPGSAAGSGTDTDSNVSDFQLAQPSNPQNLSSQCTGITNGITATGAANPSSVDAGGTTLFTVTVLPITTTGVTVTADLTPIGGSSVTNFYDDGTNGDFTAGDRIFSLSYTLPGSAGTGTKSITATARDGSGNTAVATISLSINPPQLTIMQIQGNGSRSPHEGDTVRTTGIVYAIRSNGFWIQDASGDADPMTSDGIFVFTSSAPVVNVGDFVAVSGIVMEFAASGDPSASPQTELGGNPTVSILSTGNPLPDPVTITASDIDPDGGIDQLEGYEGMRVHIDTLNVVAPTGGFITESSATATSNGVFFGTIPGHQRPFRRAGIELPAAPPSGSSCCIPFWNGAPQRIRVDTRAIATSLNVTSGAVVANITGPLDFSQHAYTIVTETTPTLVSGNITAIPVPTPDNSSEFTVASFNMQRFYDTVNDAGVSDTVLTFTAFMNRLNKASLAIRNVMMTPDIVGVAEMENLSTLQALADKVNGDAVAAGAPNPEYSAYLVEGNDVGGIDVGFLVKSRVTVNSVTQYGKDDTFIEPGGSTALLNDRPPLVLDASVTNENETTRFLAIAVHQRSLSGVDDPADGPRVREKRRAQAEYLANLIQSFQSADPNAKIVVMGDFNGFEVSDGYVDVMGTVMGNPTPADQVVLGSPDLVDPNLTDLATTLPEHERYSYINFGTSQTLDHVIVSQGMLGMLSRFAYARSNADFPEIYRSDPNRPERLSDHDMEVAYFKLPVDQTPPVLTLPADFTVEATSPAGAVVTYTVTAQDTNDGATSVLCNPASGATFPVGVNTVSCTTQDARHNVANGEFHVNVVDSTAPVVTVTGVTDGASYILGSVPVAGCSTTDGASPVAVEASLSLTVGTANGVGTFTATCSGAQDTSGNLAAPVSATYTVSYAWSGFQPPVANGGVHQAGSTIPLKWTLRNATGAAAGNQSSLTSLSAAANPDCSGAAEGAPFAIATPGSSFLTYFNGEFHINWQTKGLTGGCYSILLGLDDGTTRSTIVRLRSNGR